MRNLPLRVLALALVAVAAIAQGRDRIPAPLQFETAEQGIEAWREGLERAMAAIESRGDLSPRLERIRTDVVPALAWGLVREDGTLVATTKGDLQGFWAFMVDPAHSVLQQPGSTLRTGFDAGLTVVYIRPDQVTVRWAGVLMVHELSHLADTRTPPEKPCESEYLAYVAEREAYDAVTGGRFDKAMDAAIARHGLGDPNVVVAAGNELAGAIEDIESALAEPPPLSMAEREMRDGFYAVSLIDRIGQRAGRDAVQRCLDNAALLQRKSKY